MKFQINPLFLSISYTKDVRNSISEELWRNFFVLTLEEEMIFDEIVNRITRKIEA